MFLQIDSREHGSLSAPEKRARTPALSPSYSANTLSKLEEPSAIPCRRQTPEPLRAELNTNAKSINAIHRSALFLMERRVS
jgi:hypothetical protein